MRYNTHTFSETSRVRDFIFVCPSSSAAAETRLYYLPRLLIARISARNTRTYLPTSVLSRETRLFPIEPSPNVSIICKFIFTYRDRFLFVRYPSI